MVVMRSLPAVRTYLCVWTRWMENSVNNTQEHWRVTNGSQICHKYIIIILVLHTHTYALVDLNACLPAWHNTTPANVNGLSS